MIRVHIVDDHKILVEGLSMIVNKSGVATVTSVSHTLSECRHALESKEVDLLLLDINLPDGNGIDFCVEIREKYPEMKVLILTSHNEYSVTNRALNNGVDGYILKNVLSDEVIAGIKTVMNGNVFLCDEVASFVKEEKEQSLWLTSREQELLGLIVNGYTNKEIANEIFLSVETIKTYRKNLLLKLGAKNSMVLVKMAIEKKLI